MLVHCRKARQCLPRPWQGVPPRATQVRARWACQLPAGSLTGGSQRHEQSFGDCSVSGAEVGYDADGISWSKHVTREQFEALKDDVGTLSALFAEMGDFSGFSRQVTRAEEAVACAERIHQRLTSAGSIRHRIQGGPTTT